MPRETLGSVSGHNFAGNSVSISWQKRAAHSRVK